MDSNTPEKKPKRPRIGQTFHSAEDNTDRPRYDRPYNPTPAPKAKAHPTTKAIAASVPTSLVRWLSAASGWI